MNYVFIFPIAAQDNSAIQKNKQMLLQKVCNGNYISSIDNTNYYLSYNKKYFIAIHEINAATTKNFIYYNKEYKQDNLRIFEKDLLPSIQKYNPKQKFISMLHYYNSQNKYNTTVGYTKKDHFVVATGGPRKGRWIYSRGEPYPSPEKAVTIFNYSSAKTAKRLETNAKECQIKMAEINKTNQKRINKEKQIELGKLQRKINHEKALASIEKKIKSFYSKNVVYKANAFWKDLSNFNTARRIFDGDFKNINNITFFKANYNAFQIAYSNNCKNYLPKSSVQRGYVTQKTYSNQYDQVLRREAPVVHNIFIEKRFVDKYDAYKSAVKSYKLRDTAQQLSEMNESFKSWYFKGKKSLTDVFSDLTNNAIKSSLNLQFMRFLQLASCQSATTYQMRENFWRAAHQRTSTQSANVFIKNAKKESDSMEIIIAEKKSDEERVFFLDKMFRKCADPKKLDYGERLKIYCSCYTLGSSKVMTTKEIKHYSQPSVSFYREVIDKLSGKPPSHRFWKLNNMHNNCVQ